MDKVETIWWKGERLIQVIELGKIALATCQLRVSFYCEAATLSETASKSATTHISTNQMCYQYLPYSVLRCDENSPANSMALVCKLEVNSTDRAKAFQS